ncbi:unnamed protein product [Trichobilharzia szidati]|nr:unnamed protein product [Trichobilharzia szidati]
MDEMNRCTFASPVDRSDDDSPPVCLVELVNSKVKTSDTHATMEPHNDQAIKSPQEVLNDSGTQKKVCQDETVSLLSGVLILKSEAPVSIVNTEENKNNGLPDSNSVENTPAESIHPNTHSSEVKEPNMAISCENTVQCGSGFPVSERYLHSNTKKSPFYQKVEDDDDLDFEDRPLTVVTQEADDVLPAESVNGVTLSTNNVARIIPNKVTENTQTSITGTTVNQASVTITSTTSLPNITPPSTSSSSTSCLSTNPPPNVHLVIASSKNYSSDGHNTCAPVALATVAPIRMSSVGPEYSVSHESLRPIKPALQDVMTSTVMPIRPTPQTLASAFPSSVVTKHEVTAPSSVSYNSKPSSSHINTIEPSSITISVSVCPTSIPISVAPVNVSLPANTLHMPSIFSVRTRPAVAQSVLPLISVGPQPNPPLTPQTSLPSLPSQPAVHFMPFIGNMSGTIPVSANNTGLRNIVNPSPAIPMAGPPTAPCPPLQIFNMTPMPQFVGAPSFVLHPTGPLPGPNNFQFPPGPTHLLPPGLTGGTGVGGNGGTTYNFLQPPQNYAPTMFPQNPNISDLLIDSQNSMALGHSILAPPASIAVIGAINNANSSSLTSLYPNVFHPQNQNFFSTSCAQSGPVSYPYSTALANTTNLVNATTPQMTTSLVSGEVSNLSNETTHFMFQSDLSSGNPFVSNNFNPNTGQLYQSCQFPTFHNPFQANDNCSINNFVSSALPTDLTSTCDSKSSSLNGTCMPTYWPLVNTSGIGGDMTTTTATTTTPSANVQVSHSNNPTNFISPINDFGMKSQVQNTNVDDKSNNNNHNNNGLNNLQNITTSSTVNTNPLCSSFNGISVSNVMASNNPPLKSGGTTTNSFTFINNNNNNNNNDNDNSIKNDSGNNNTSSIDINGSSTMPSNSTAIVLPAIRRRRRLFAQNGIKPITNVIQTPVLNHANLTVNEDNSVLMNNTSVNNICNVVTTESNIIQNTFTHSDNSKRSVNDTLNTENMNNNNIQIGQENQVGGREELKQTNTLQCAYPQLSTASNSDVVTFNKKPLQEFVEDTRPFKRLSTERGEYDHKSLGDSFTEMQENDSMELDITMKTSYSSSPSSSLSSSSSCASFVNTCRTTPIMSATDHCVSTANSNSRNNTSMLPKVTSSQTTDSQSSSNAANRQGNNDSSLPSSTSLPYSPNHKFPCKNDDFIHDENMKVLAAEKQDDNVDDEDNDEESEKCKTVTPGQHDNQQVVDTKSVESFFNVKQTSVQLSSTIITTMTTNTATTTSTTNTTTTTSTVSSSASCPKLKSTTPFQFPPPPVLIGLDDRRILTHYIDGHVIYESDKPFPVKNGMVVVEEALLKQFSGGTTTPPKTILVNGYGDENDENMTNIKSITPCSPVLSNNNNNNLVKAKDAFKSDTTLVTSAASKTIGDWMNPVKVSCASTVGHKIVNLEGQTNHSTILSNYETQRQLSSELSSDVHDENDSSANIYRSSKGILASCPHSTILSLASRHSASVVYSQLPVVSIPDRQSSNLRGNDQSVDCKTNHVTGNPSDYSSVIGQQHQCHESLMQPLSKPLNEIQSSSTGTTAGSTGNVFNQSVSPPPQQHQQHQQRSQTTMFSTSQQPTSSLLTPTPPPKGPVYKWTPDDVVAFVRGTPGCSAYASAFLNNEIDGEALLLLAEDQFIQPPIATTISTTTTSTVSSSASCTKLKSTTPFQFPPPPVLIGLDDRRILTHYIDGHVIYESDKPFPVSV